MGQFVAACARDASHVSDLLSRGAATAAALVGREPDAFHLAGTVGVLGFSRAQDGDTSGHLHKRWNPSAWCIGAGTWIDRTHEPPVSAAGRIAAAHDNPSALAGVLQSIDGSYGFVTGADDDDSIRVASDPLGQLHVYRIQLDGAVLISTSAIVLAHIGNRGWNPLAVREFLARGTVYADRSLFAGVHKTSPATISTFRAGRHVDTRRYWTIREHVIASSAAADSLRCFADAIYSATTDIYRQFPQPALDLTGGFDSRILLAAVRRARPGRSIDTVVVGGPQDADTLAAARIAAACNLNHQRIDNIQRSGEAWWRLAQAALPLVDGEYDILEYARIMSVHRALAERFGVSVNGSGGELIRGYWWELLFPGIGRIDAFDAERVARQRFATDDWAEPLLAERFGDSLTSHFRDVIEAAVADLRGLPNTASMDSVYLTLRMQRWQGRLSSATNRIWPCVSPLLFRDAMGIALAAPVALRRNARMARRLLTDMDRALAALPLAEGYPALPINLRTIHRFTPLAREWSGRVRRRLARSLPKAREHAAPAPVDHGLRTLLAVEEVNDLLNPAEMRTAELYRTPQLRQLRDAIGRYAQPQAHVGRMLTLEQLARLRARLPRA